MYSHTDRAVLYAGDWIQNILLTHIEMFEDMRMRSGLYHFFHIALVNDFGSFALLMSDNLFESAHCSTASPSLSGVGTVAVELPYYDVRFDSLSQWRE